MSTLTRRFLAAQIIVLSMSLAVGALVASLVGMSVFHDHLLMAGLITTSEQLEHVEQAFRDTGLVTLPAMTITVVICATATSMWLSRHLRRQLNVLVDAAVAVAQGDYPKHAIPPTGTAEIAVVTDAFNVMAEKLVHTEEVRRQLLSDLAHEMNTPVSVLAIYLDGLEDGVTSWNQETATILREQLDRLTRLLHDLDDVSRAQEHRHKLKLTTQKVLPLIQAATGAVSEAYQLKKVTLSVQLTATDITIRVDKQRFGQIMGNLLTNALRHTPPGGTVSVTVDQNDTETVTISVTDSGEGITADQLPHIFERFYRGDTARSRENAGSGIGLTIAKALVEQHSGTLSAHSTGIGQGASFHIQLPLNLEANLQPTTRDFITD